jgi:hypothetical protein
MSYDMFKAIHLLGVILCFGHDIVTRVAKAPANQTGEPRRICCFGPARLATTSLRGSQGRSIPHVEQLTSLMEW